LGAPPPKEEQRRRTRESDLAPRLVGHDKKEVTSYYARHFNQGPLIEGKAGVASRGIKGGAEKGVTVLR